MKNRQRERKEVKHAMSERDREGGGLENMLRERRMLLKNEKDLKNTREGR